MSRRLICWKALPWACMLALLAGCDGWSESAAEDVTEESLADEPTAMSPVAAPIAPAAFPAPAVPANAAPLSSRMIVKTVSHVLRQNTPQGPIDIRSLLELTLLIDSAEGATPPATVASPRQYRVRCLRVRLSQELPGQLPLSYDSNAPPSPVPAAAALYQGLPGECFAFRMTPEGQLAEVIGFEPFLERCLQALPVDRRAPVRASLAISSPQEGLAWLIDESVGLLPPQALAPGYQWSAGRHIAAPTAMAVNTRYTLRQLTADAADIDVAGLILPVRSLAPTPPARETQIIVRGGQVQGQCRVDRHSGLPLRSRIEQSLQMTVRLESGAEIEQSRTTVTTLAPLEATAAGEVSQLSQVRPPSARR